MRLASFIPLFGAAALSAGVLAQEPSQQKEDEIVVTATVEKDIKDFVDGVINVSNFGQLSRFEDAICPIVAGVSQSQKMAVASRMRDVAKAVGIRTGGADCRPNVLVLVAADKKALIEQFVDLYPASMRDLSRSERRALIASAAPAIAWHMKGAPVDSAGAEIGEKTEGVYVNRAAGSASRLTQPARPQFAVAVVVIDSAELTGLSTTQLADYAAMRAFLKTDPAKLADSKIPTILKILDAPDDAEVPPTLTEWDLNALRGYYNVDRTTSVASQRSGVRKKVKDNMVGADKREN